MRSILRSVLAILLGWLAASVFIMAVELLNATLYPLPPGVEPQNTGVTSSWRNPARYN